ncbi:hypothetical protein Lepto7375DRAFT_6980 [Leptolyngbya sp. PCC 7375]|nr:hypothetical protein Lepto7375DRAFT_6980 [Leptolyngbya sp. PCC 7375]
MTANALASPRFSNPFKVLFKQHPEAVAAITCAILVLLGWQALNFGWMGGSLLILTAAYVIGGFDSARDGLTTESYAIHTPSAVSRGYSHIRSME